MGGRVANALYLPKGAGVGQPGTGEAAIVVDADGTWNTMDSDGTKTPIGGGGGTVETDGTLSGDGSGGSPLGIAAGNVAALQAILTPIATATVVGAAVTDLDLALPTDGDYDVTCYLVSGAAAPSITVQPNAVSTNQQTSVLYGPIGSTPDAHSATVASLYLSALDTNYTAVARFFLRRVGGVLVFQGQSEAYDGSNLGKNVYNFIGRWSAPAALTSIRLHSSVASGLGVGTVVTARRQVLL